MGNDPKNVKARVMALLAKHIILSCFISVPSYIEVPLMIFEL